MHRQPGSELYSISVVAEMFGLNPQTIRLYESHGLLDPQRTEGGTRMYSPADVERLRTICHLVNDMGVNLAGVEVILKLMDQYQEQERRMKETFREVLRNLQQEFSNMSARGQGAVVRLQQMDLVTVKNRVMDVTTDDTDDNENDEQER